MYILSKHLKQFFYPSFKSQMENHLTKSESVVQWPNFELVWAKVEGYPWWPAKILHLPHQRPQKYRVSFIGDHSQAILNSNKIVSYVYGRQHLSPLRRSRSFESARAEAESLYNLVCSRVEINNNDQACKRSSDRQVSGESLRKKENREITQHLSKIVDSPRSQKTVSKQLWREASSSLVSEGRQSETDFETAYKLLEKYNLIDIPELDEYESDRRVPKPPRPVKAIRKSPKSPSINSDEMKGKLIAKIHMILKRKRVQKAKSHHYSGLMANFLLNNNSDRLGAHRQFFKWLIKSDEQQILQSYKNWQTEQKK